MRMVLLALLSIAAISAQSRVAFTATAINSVYKPSGDVAVTEELMFATRSDGSTVHVRKIITPAELGDSRRRTIVDLSRAERVAIDERRRLMIIDPLQKGTIEHLRKASNCTSDDSAVRSSLLGYEVVRVVHDLRSPDYVVRFEEWRAPGLDCFTLKQIISRGRNEADLYVSSVMEVFQVLVEEPAPWLFERPAGYIEQIRTATTTAPAAKPPAGEAETGAGSGLQLR